MLSANTPVFGQDILVKMQRDDNMIALRTYSRKGGARGRLLIFADAYRRGWTATVSAPSTMQIAEIF